MAVSRKRLDEISVIADHDIDTSEIPEADGAWFTNATVVLPHQARTSVKDDLERPVCSFCGAHAQSSAPQGWFSAELEHVVDEDEEMTTVEVWEAVACPDCEEQIRATATHLAAQGWQPVPDPL